MKKYLGCLALLLALGGTAYPQQQNASLSNPVGANIFASGANCANANVCIWQKLPSTATTTTVTITGTFTATLIIETSADGGITWTQQSSQAAPAVVTFTTTSLTDVRVRCSAFTSGTASANIQTAGNQINISGGGSGLPAGGSVGNTVVNTAPGVGTWQGISALSGICTAPQGCTGVASPTAHADPQAEGASVYNFIGPGLTGQVKTATNGADPSYKSPGMSGTDVNSATYLVQCDSGTALLDRGTTLRFITTAPTVTVPDPTAAGCGSNFAFIMVASGVTATVNRTTTAVFNIYNGSTVTTGATTFTLTTGQYATVSSPDNVNWLVRITTGTSTAHAVSTVLDCAAASASGTAYTCTTSPTFTPADGDAILFEADVANTGAATLNVNASSAAPLQKQTGTALVANDIKAGADVLLIYDGTNWQLQVGNAAATFSTSVATSTGCASLTAGTAGTDCLVEGTAPSANQASADTPWADSTAHSPKVMNNGSLLQSLYVLSEPSPISLTGQVATITNGTSLCAAAAGACNQAGQYRATIYLDSTVTCATPGPAVAAPTLTWTDEVGTKTAVPFPMFVNGSTTPASSITLGNTTSWGSGSLTFWSTGASAVGYGVALTACTSGTATYAARLAVERLQ